jgi:hypothetical protein
LTPKSDETGNSSTLPAPELNPLLNPVLNKNLGRWAEVYFTNPPERRDEAVLNLVRQLENEPDTPESAPRRSPPRRPEKQSSSVNSPTAKTTTCPGCGFENEVDQRFCGECGGPLGASASASSILARPLEAEHTQSGGERTEAAPQFGSILHLTDPPAGSFKSGSGDARWHNDELAPGMEDAESVPLKRSYRLYVGMVLAVVIAGLAYLAWHGGQFAPQRSLFPAQAPPAAVESSPQAQAVQPQAPPPSPASSPASPAPAEASSEQPQDATKQTSAPKTPAVPKDSLAVSTNGNQELATALSFLNGQHRDSTQAAQWLWKAMEKQNTAATVLLAGLYLRGDGVQKNCDQGRVLLDAAADKGSKDAASLLRNLQAFGCE